MKYEDADGAAIVDKIDVCGQAHKRTDALPQSSHKQSAPCMPGQRISGQSKPQPAESRSVSLIETG